MHMLFDPHHSPFYMPTAPPPLMLLLVLPTYMCRSIPGTSIQGTVPDSWCQAPFLRNNSTLLM